MLFRPQTHPQIFNQSQGLVWTLNTGPIPGKLPRKQERYLGAFALTSRERLKADRHFLHLQQQKVKKA